MCVCVCVCVCAVSYRIAEVVFLGRGLGVLLKAADMIVLCLPWH